MASPFSPTAEDAASFGISLEELEIAYNLSTPVNTVRLAFSALNADAAARGDNKFSTKLFLEAATTVGDLYGT
jgi:hypothetical protein